MEVADDGREPHDVLAVEIDDEAQDAVRRGMVRPEVDRQHIPGREQLLGGAQEGRNRARNPRTRVDRGNPRLGSDRHYSASENRTGSPPIG